MADNNRVGIGYDAHPLLSGRKLVLGGVEIPFHKGLGGWSDADALIHAIMDALLGAAALGDIGCHFPPGDMEYKGISSLVLLEKVRDKLGEAGWKVINLDATVIAEQPRLREYIDRMRQNIARVMEVDVSRVGLKASTSSQMGFIGRGEGIAACAVALISGVSGQIGFDDVEK